jgi:transcriptional regulator with XRE-family HTH domain
MGRHSKEIEPTAQGAPLGRFLRKLQTASGMTWRELGAASHMSHTTLSQGADGHLASRWDTVELWLRAFYRGVTTQRVDGWGLEEALVHARTLWLYCQECARLGKPVDDDIEFPNSMQVPGNDSVEPAVQTSGQSIIMEIREADVPSLSAPAGPTAETATRAMLAQPAAVSGRKVGLQNLHEARSAAEFLAAIEDARAAAGLPWADLIGFLFESAPVQRPSRAMAGGPTQ